MCELSEIQPPQMDWNGSDLPTAFKSFEQYCQLIFDGPLNQKEEKVKATYILLWIDEKGRKIFNSFELSDEEKQKLDVIFDKFATYVETKSNFRIARYQLQGQFRQSDDESVDSFMARCNIQAQKCRFSEAEIEDRLIEQLIIGTREPKVQSNSDFDELLFASIQIDSSAVNPARDEAFAKVQVELPDINHPKPMLKMKVDTGTQGNILPLRIYRNMFPEHVDDNGLPTGTTPTQTKLTAYNGTPIVQHGVCSIKCSYGGKETNARFYVADVNGPAICGLPTSCELQLLELLCGISTTQIPNPTIRDKSDLQMLHAKCKGCVIAFKDQF